MIYPVIITSAAFVVAEVIMLWYEREQPGLGAQFEQTLIQTLQPFAEFPHAAPVYYRDVRKVMIRPYPVFAFYRVLPDIVQVVAVADARRNPKHLRTLLKGR